MPRFLLRVPLPVPKLGDNVDLVEAEIPQEYLWKSQNMLIRFGQLRTRPGLRAV